MTPERFFECLDLLHWSMRGVAEILLVNERTVRRWGAGTYPIPEPVAQWLDGLARFHADNPPPPRRDF